MSAKMILGARENGPANLLNATFIGYMVGTYNVIGKGGAQAIANMAGEFVGKEILAFAASQGEQIDSVEALVRFLKEHHLGEVELRVNDSHVQAVVSKCGICPKRVGKYQFDGTACPWAGILIGALGSILGREFSVSASLTPAQSCTLQLKMKE